MEGDSSHSKQMDQVRQIELEVFESNQNKSTEQKYAELKMKYNELLNKHLNLAALKADSQRANNFPQTMQQTLDHSNFELDKAYGHSIRAANPQKSTDFEHNPKFCNFEIDSNYEEQHLHEDLDRQVEPKICSQFTSQNETPRGAMNQNSNKKSSQASAYQKHSVQSKNIASQKVYSEVTHIEARGPVMTDQSPIIGKLTETSAPKKHLKPATNGAHKRSISDGIFNNIIPSNKLN